MQLLLKSAADAILILHVGYVSFVVLGFLIILLGGLLRWNWVKNFWFRAVHLLEITIVVLEPWAGIPCPLTVWENNLRLQAGLDTYNESFIAAWLHRILFYELPPQSFTVAYSLFGSLVLLSLLLIPPRLPSRHKQLTS